MLSSFLSPDNVSLIFDNHNMFDDCTMVSVFLSLIGGSKSGIKPYECVGTFNECAAAVELSAMQYARNSKSDDSHFIAPYVLQVLMNYLSLEVSSTRKSIDSEIIVDLISEFGAGVILKWANTNMAIYRINGET
jgi:hypothetical protein